MRETAKPDAKLWNILPPQKIDTETVYIQSQFVFSHTSGGRTLLFNTLTRQIIETDGEIHGRVTGRDAAENETLRYLAEHYILVPESKDECSFYKGIFRILHSYASVKGIQGYTILPTLACNARCVYCYEEGMKPQTMTRETALETVDFILRTKDRDVVKLNWFGGEPLLGEKIIDLICAKLGGAGIKFVSTMISNGSLITPKIVAKMKNDWNIVSVQISMDGAFEDYNSRKRYVSGDDHYRKVLNSVSAMSEAGIRVVIRGNVDGDNWPGIPEFIDDLGKDIRCKDNVSLYFCPLYSVRSSENDVEMWQKIIAADPLIEQAGIRPGRLLSFSRKMPSNHCIADGRSIVIAPDGSLYSCEHCLPESRCGSVKGNSTDEDARNAFCRTGIIRDKCRKCVFLPECTGFSACPVEDRHCRRVREILAADMLDRLAVSIDPDGEREAPDSNC